MANDPDSRPDVSGGESAAQEARTGITTSEGVPTLKEKNLLRIAKKNNMREKIILDVIDDDITSVDGVTREEMEAYNREYETFMAEAQSSMPVYPEQKVMVANILDYLRYSEDGHPAMLYYSDDLKIPLITLDSGNEIKPHSDSTGLYYVLEGEGTITVGMKHYAVRGGSLIHVPSGIIRSIRCQDAMKIMAIHLS